MYKHSFIPALFMLLAISVDAQSPALINYQGAARSAAGNVIPNKNIMLRLSIRNGAATGAIEYTETRSVTTNAFGLFNLQIGSSGATSVIGTLAGVNWASGTKFLQVEIDENGGTAFINMGASQLVSVPYAIHAGSASPGGAAGGDLTGLYPNPFIADNTISTTKIINNAVTTVKINDAAITNAKLGDNAVTTGKIIDNAIITAKIGDAVITTPKLADNAVTTAKITDNAIITAKVNDAAITTLKLADNAITTAKITDNAITTAKVNDAAITTLKLADNAVTTAKITDDAITTTKVNDAAITTLKLADNAVSTAKILDNSVSTSKLQDAAITGQKLADNGVTGIKIAGGEVVKSINGFKDDVVLAGGGGTTVSTANNTITITGSGGDITGITAGNGLLGGGTTGAVSLSAAFGGNGILNTISRSDHTHVGQTWTTNAGTLLTLTDNDPAGIGLNVYSYGTSYNAAAISAQVLTTTGQSVGVFGNTLSNDALAAGVFGQAARTGGAKAVWGYAQGSNTYAIYGDAVGVNSWAGYFQGRVHVNGILSKAAGSFKIDHPLDPLNKYLSHSFVESPDMMNVYNGNIVLDNKGSATIIMPAYFEALNRDFRYQLTAIGAPSPNVYIAEEINGNKFRIAGGSPGAKISWMITGIRHDSFAESNRIPVEEDKPANEKGTYLNGKNNHAVKPPRNMSAVQETSQQ